MQKKAVSLITNSKFNAHTSILFKQLSILKLNDLCTLHDYKLCYKFINGPTPEYFANVLNPNDSDSDSDSLFRPCITTNTIGSGCPRRKGIRY